MLRELLAQGAGTLADVELLALLLKTGVKGLPVLQFAQSLLDRFDGLGGLLHAALPDLVAMKGLGPAKSAEVAAILELAKRSLSQQMRATPVFDSPDRVKQFLQLQLAQRPHEIFAVLFLDSQHRLLAFEELFRGTLTQTSVYPREVVKRALDVHAAAVILSHNHPSGATEPSRADELLTSSLKASLALVDVKVLDHIVVGRGGTVSFAERGLL